MTIDKAIEIITQIVRFSNYPFMPDDKNALQLANSALKQIQQVRRLNLAIILEPLSGETWENPPAAPSRKTKGVKNETRD